MANFLVLVSDRIGEALFCTPAVELLKQRRNHNNIIIIAPNEMVAEVWVNNQSVSQLLVEPTPAELAAVASKEDLVIDLDNSRRSRTIAKRLKLSVLTCPKSDTAHKAEVALNFIDNDFPGDSNIAQPQLRIHPADEHFVAASRLLSVVTKNAQQLIVFHLGAGQSAARPWWQFWKQSSPTKSWPVENFVALAKAIATEWPQAQIILTGAEPERALAARFLAEFPSAISFVGKTCILTLAAVMQKIDVFVTGDTGPLHVASAMQTPLIALFGGEDGASATSGPYPAAADRLKLVANPISAIRVQDVMVRLRTLIDQETLSDDSKHDGVCQANS